MSRPHEHDWNAFFASPSRHFPAAGGALVCFLLFTVSGFPDGALEAQQEDPLRVGFTTRTFGNVNRADANAAMEVWVETLMKDRGVKVGADTHIYEELARMADDVEAEALDLVVMLADEFMTVDSGKLVPFFTTVRGGNSCEEYILLAQRDSGISSWKNLEGKTLNLLDSPTTSLSPIWMNVELMNSQLPRAEQLCGTIARVPTVSKAVLPVFFGQRDACLVNRSGFRTVAELNPQVGKSLIVVAHSPGYQRSIIALHRTYLTRSAYRDDLIDSLAKLHEGPHGQQILLVFHIDKLIAFQPAHLETARSLFKEYRELEAQAAQQVSRVPRAVRPSEMLVARRLGDSK